MGSLRGLRTKKKCLVSGQLAQENRAVWLSVFSIFPLLPLPLSNSDKCLFHVTQKWGLLFKKKTQPQNLLGEQTKAKRWDLGESSFVRNTSVDWGKRWKHFKYIAHTWTLPRTAWTSLIKESTHIHSFITITASRHILSMFILFLHYFFKSTHLS